MHLDHVDLFYSHRFDPNTPMEETLQAMVDIVKQGKARYLGISRWPLQAFEFANQYLSQRDVPLLIYQGRLNMLDKEVIDNGILNYCKHKNIGFIGFSPLAQGLLTDRYLHGNIPTDSRMAKEKFLKHDALTPELLHQLHEWNKEATENGLSLAERALDWVLEQEGVTSVIVGASSVEQLEKNIKAAYNRQNKD